mmetsp:Transcript_27145/g.67276  ORF Transcript_27145/g.67276 Transcript_27145/m.67276 type:complete len:358 (-) Transcript_27145:2753-3826(-)
MRASKRNHVRAFEAADSWHELCFDPLDHARSPRRLEEAASDRLPLPRAARGRAAVLVLVHEPRWQHRSLAKQQMPAETEQLVVALASGGILEQREHLLPRLQGRVKDAALADEYDRLSHGDHTLRTAALELSLLRARGEWPHDFAESSVHRGGHVDDARAPHAKVGRLLHRGDDRAAPRRREESRASGDIGRREEEDIGETLVVGDDVPHPPRHGEGRGRAVGHRVRYAVVMVEPLAQHLVHRPLDLGEAAHFVAVDEPLRVFWLRDHHLADLVEPLVGAAAVVRYPVPLRELLEPAVRRAKRVLPPRLPRQLVAVKHAVVRPHHVVHLVGQVERRLPALIVAAEEHRVDRVVPQHA